MQAVRTPVLEGVRHARGAGARPRWPSGSVPDASRTRRRDDVGLDDEHLSEGSGRTNCRRLVPMGPRPRHLAQRGSSSAVSDRREGVSVNSQQWNDRYSGDELVWTSTPNQFLVAEVDGLPAGRAVDLACGEGRNSIWLAEQRLAGDGRGLLAGRFGEGQAVRRPPGRRGHLGRVRGGGLGAAPGRIRPRRRALSPASPTRSLSGPRHRGRVRGGSVAAPCSSSRTIWTT